MVESVPFVSGRWPLKTSALNTPNLGYVTERMNELGAGIETLEGTT